MSTDAEPAEDGLYLYAVVRSRGLRLRHREVGEGVVRVRYRELEALVRAAPYAMPELDVSRLEDHQKVVERVMRRATVLPAPYGIVFRGRRAVLRFLEDQYLVLDEGLAFLEGRWVMRLHILGEPDLADGQATAARLYADLRQSARAAVPLRPQGDTVLSAAFLVERATWVRFVEQVDDLGRAHPELVFDLTGPWPPYDFVEVRP